MRRPAARGQCGGSAGRPGPLEVAAPQPYLPADAPAAQRAGRAGRGRREPGKPRPAPGRGRCSCPPPPPAAAPRGRAMPRGAEALDLPAWSAASAPSGGPRRRSVSGALGAVYRERHGPPSVPRPLPEVPPPPPPRAASPAGLPAPAPPRRLPPSAVRAASLLPASASPETLALDTWEKPPGKRLPAEGRDGAAAVTRRPGERGSSLAAAPRPPASAPGRGLRAPRPAGRAGAEG